MTIDHFWYAGDSINCSIAMLKNYVAQHAEHTFEVAKSIDAVSLLIASASNHRPGKVVTT